MRKLKTIIRHVRIWLARICILLGDCVAPPSPPPKISLLDLRVRELVAAVDKLDASGEYKKWQLVASRLQKEFPDKPKRDLNLLIELAVQKLHAQSR